jgi:hypothetical protein
MGAFSAGEGEDAAGGTLLTREAARMEGKEARKQPSKEARESRSEGPGLRTSRHRWNCGLYGNPAKEDQDLGPPQDLVDSAEPRQLGVARHRRTGLPPIQAFADTAGQGSFFCRLGTTGPDGIRSTPR